MKAVEKFKAGNAAEYRKLVTRVGDGASVPAAEIRPILNDAGKTPADLEHDATISHQRGELRKVMASGAASKKELEIVRTKRGEAYAVLQAAEEAHSKTDAPLAHREMQLKEVIAESNRARIELIASCLDGDLLAKEAELLQQRDTLSHQCGSWRERSYQKVAEPPKRQRLLRLSAQEESEARAHEEERERVAKVVAAAKKEVARIEEELAAIDAALASIENQKLA